MVTYSAVSGYLMRTINKSSHALRLNPSPLDVSELTGFDYEVLTMCIMITCYAKIWNERIETKTYQQIITCYANDFKFENWIARTIKKYGEKGDLLILISSSGESSNMIKAAKSAKKKGFSKIITFTGFEKDNKLSKLGDVNFWISSKDYNKVESAHHLYLLLIVDLIKKN